MIMLVRSHSFRRANDDRAYRTLIAEAQTLAAVSGKPVKILFYTDTRIKVPDESRLKHACSFATFRCDVEVTTGSSPSFCQSVCLHCVIGGDRTRDGTISLFASTKTQDA